MNMTVAYFWMAGNVFLTILVFFILQYKKNKEKNERIAQAVLYRLRNANKLSTNSLKDSYGLCIDSCGYCDQTRDFIDSI